MQWHTTRRFNRDRAVVILAIVSCGQSSARHDRLSNQSSPDAPQQASRSRERLGTLPLPKDFQNPTARSLFGQTSRRFSNLEIGDKQASFGNSAFL